MSHPTETTLTALPASAENERILVVLVQNPGEGSHVEMRQQSFGEGIGWFTQGTIRMEPGQVAALKSALGLASTGKPSTSRLPREYSKVPTSTWQPRIVHADSA
ncbi:MAG: hypothetical protein K8R36_13710 [Planctomycetales bacterium]|nr:hypothetical protein [Planctomycetales bacterium]